MARRLTSVALTLAAPMVFACGESSSELETQLLDLGDQISALECSCDSTGFDSAEDCRARRAVPEVARACAVEIAEDLGGALDDDSRCRIDLAREQLSCMQGANCDPAGLMQCKNTASAGIGACQALAEPGAEDQFEKDLAQCIRTRTSTTTG